MPPHGSDRRSYTRGPGSPAGASGAGADVLGSDGIETLPVLGEEPVDLLVHALTAARPEVGPHDGRGLLGALRERLSGGDEVEEGAAACRPVEPGATGWTSKPAQFHNPPDGFVPWASTRVGIVVFGGVTSSAG